MGDDDSVMQCIANCLDIESASAHMEKLGYLVIFSNDTRRKFIRSRGPLIESLLMDINTDHQLLVQHSENGTPIDKPLVIQTWDDWITYVRIMTYRMQTMAFKACSEIKCE